jgi:hypothetical protein
VAVTSRRPSLLVALAVIALAVACTYNHRAKQADVDAARASAP